MSSGLSAQLSPCYKVAILHPDLGIGGAERLVLDAALELSKIGCNVVLYTGYHDVNRCFEETLLDGHRRASWIKVHGAWMPRQICGRLHAPFANLRALWTSTALLLFERHIDVVIVDQVSAPLALFRFFSSIKVLFYCHYPDMLLAKRDSWWRRLYRSPLDLTEQLTLGLAHKVLVNSEYTRETFARTFKSLYRSGLHPAVLYPAVGRRKDLFEKRRNSNHLTKAPKAFLSINRFERKKNLSLALQAFALFRTTGYSVDKKATRLIFAGGFDERIRDDVEHLKELKREACTLGVQSDVSFLPCVSAEQKAKLLSDCLCVLYTPENEHFGIVPLEAMAAGKPVLACKSGGPVESIIDRVTGFTCEACPKAFASAMGELFRNPEMATRMGLVGQQHVEKKFSRKSFGRQLYLHVNELLDSSNETKHDCSVVYAILVGVLLSFIMLIFRNEVNL